MTGVLLVVLLVVIVAVVAIAGALIAMYNGLVKLNIKVEEAWSGITVQLKRRADMIPNLVETVKGYAAHEKGVFEKVTEARASIMNATTPHDAAKADGELTSALKSLFAVSENYPYQRYNSNYSAPRMPPAHYYRQPYPLLPDRYQQAATLSRCAQTSNIP
jgi:LemA protein